MADSIYPGLIKAILSSAWQAPQTLFGLGRGIAKTGGLPRPGTDPKGNLEWRFDVEGEDPLAIGQTITGPKGISDEHLAHERVHSRQSRELGPGYTPMRVLGDYLSKLDTGETYYGHPMESEAYLETASPEELENYLMMAKAYRKMKK